MPFPSGGLTVPSTILPSYEPEPGWVSAAYCSHQHSRCLRLHVRLRFPMRAMGCKLYKNTKLHPSKRSVSSLSHLRVSLSRCPYGPTKLGSSTPGSIRLVSNIGTRFVWLWYVSVHYGGLSLNIKAGQHNAVREFCMTI